MSVNGLGLGLGVTTPRLPPGGGGGGGAPALVFDDANGWWEVEEGGTAEGYLGRDQRGGFRVDVGLGGHESALSIEIIDGRPAIVEEEYMQLISSHNPSDIATLDIELPDGYAFFEIVGWLRPATDNAVLWGRVSPDEGSSFDEGAADYSWRYDRLPDASGTLDDDDSKIVTGPGVGSAAGEYIALRATIFRARDSAPTSIRGAVTRLEPGSGDWRMIDFSGTRLASQVDDHFRWLFSSGNIAEGEVRLLGGV